jgi:hypothetical protein
VHRGDQRHLGRFTGRTQALIERPQHGITPHRSPVSVRGDSLADEAGRCEPFSAAGFPASRENCREFSPFGPHLWQTTDKID